VIGARERGEVAEAAAAALTRIFAAPAAVFVADDGGVRLAAAAGAAQAAPVDLDAARTAAETGKRLHGETYPFDESRFDLWPVTTPGGCRYVLGVDFVTPRLERPSDPERFIEVVGAYLVASHGARR
jgi:hypothetical protein